MSATVITGLGAVSAMGSSASELWAALLRGYNGIGPITRFDCRDLASQLGAMVPSPLGEEEDRTLAYALAAGREALEDARLQKGGRIGLVLGTSLGGRRRGLADLADDVANGLGLGGPRIVISTACSSSTHAVGLARDLLRAGQADVVLAGGSDELTAELMAGFCALGVVSPSPCAPFSVPLGITLGEGAGFVVVEPARYAAARGARARAWLRGYGLSADAHHATSPEPSGAGVRRAIQAALSDAEIDPSLIDYVNAHGTGTAGNDAAEFRAISATLGAGERLPWVSSSKSFLGHAQGAAGILELIVTVLGMENALLPCTMGFTTPRPRCPRDPVAGDAPRPGAFAHALSLSSAFGGANAAILVSREPGPAVARSPERVCVVGAALVGPGGVDLADAVRGRLPLRGRAADLSIAQVVRGVDPRGVDRLTTMMAVAVQRALASAAIDLRAGERDRVGLFAGQIRAATEAEREFRSSIDERGLARLSAPAFSRVVLNACAGAVTRMFDLRGPVTAMTSGASSGTCVVALAADYLSHHHDVDTIIAVGASEAAEGATEDAEGACALVLTTRGEPRPWAELTGWALGLERGEVGSRALGSERGWAEARTIEVAHACSDRGGLGGALSCALAAESVRRGSAPLVVVMDDRASTKAAVAFAVPAPSEGNTPHGIADRRPT